MAKYAEKVSVGISLFLCSTNCMLLNTVHRGRWEYIARSIIDIIIIISVIVNISTGCYSMCNHLDVITMFWSVSDRSSGWLHTAKKLHWQYDLWCMMVDVVRKSSCFHTSPHVVSVLRGLVAVFTKTTLKLVLFASS